MKLFILISIHLLWFPYLSWSAFNIREVDFWMEKSPAFLTQSKKITLSSTYSQIYSLKELTHIGIGFIVPNPLGSSAMSTTQFGNSLYQERKIIFSHGFNLQDRLNLGFNIKGMFLKIQDYGTDSTIQFDSGIKINLSPNLTFSTTLWNLNRASLVSRKEKLPTGFSTTIKKHFLSKLEFELEVNRIDPTPFTLGTTVSFPLITSFILQAGYKDRPAQFLGGFKVKFPQILLDYNYIQNANLPGTHHMILTCELGK